MRKIAPILTAILLALLLLGNSGCEATPNVDAQVQDTTMERVRAQNPIPDINYSQTYDSVIRWIDRWDAPDKVSYVYILADTGQIIGYYVAQGRPVSTCTFLTSPVRVKGSTYDAPVVVPAPALDGVYYGNCGESSVFFFTADTDAFIEIGGLNYFVTDQPLAIEAQEFTIALQE